MLYSLEGYPIDGSWPNGGLSQDQKGNLYGTTLSGGKNSMGGIVWKLTIIN